MKKVFLHVGNFKTGTSAIQKFCHDQREELANLGFDYLQSARPTNNLTNHGELPLSLCKAHGIFTPEWYTDTRPCELVTAEVREEIDKSPCDNIIISSEEFHRLPGIDENLNNVLRGILRDLFENLEVTALLYVRPPLEYAKSMYNQVSRVDKPGPRFTDFFTGIPEDRMVPLPQARFWRSAFGEQSLVVQAYSGDRTGHIEEMLSLAGMDKPPPASRTYLEVNPARDEVSLEVERIARIAALGDPEKAQRLMTTQAFNDKNAFGLLLAKIERINLTFQQFYLDENLTFANADFCLADVLVHENRVNNNYATYRHLNPFSLRLSDFKNRVQRWRARRRVGKQ